jgi:hypothetical protein
MSPRKVSSSVVHELPADLRKALTSDPKALSAVGGYHAPRTQRVDLLV